MVPITPKCYPFQCDTQLNFSRCFPIQLDRALNTAQKRNSERIELAFPKYDEEDVAKGFGTDVVERFSTSIEDITSWFSKYEVDTIELWISSIIETSGIF